MLPIDYTITFSIGAIVGFCIRMVIEDKIIRKRDIDKRYADAFNVFAQSFNLALHMLDQRKETSYAVAYLATPTHRDAMLNFIHFLEGERKNRFNEIWIEYEHKYSEIKKHGEFLALWEADNYPEYFIIQDNPEELEKDQQYKTELKNIITTLLEAAKK